MSQLNIELATQFTIQAPSTVTAATNASPIAITTAANHGLNTGDIVQVTGSTGNTAANGQFVVTKTGATTFTLNNSNGNAAWVSGGTVTHIGHSTATPLLVDNTVFATAPSVTLQARIERVSAGNTRVVFEDAADSAFVTAEPLAMIQSTGAIGATGPGVYAGQAGQYDKMFTAKYPDIPDFRVAASGDNLRLKVFASGGTGAVVQYSGWLQY